MGSCVDGAWRQPRAVSGRERLPGRARAGGPRRADVAGRPRAPGVARHDARHLSAQQRPHGRGGAADRGVLRVRRARRHRHRQPGEHAGSERVRRSGRRCTRWRRRCRPRPCSTAPRARVRARSASTPTSARSSRASARGCWRSTCRRGPTMWKNTWCRACSPAQIHWLPRLMFTRLRTYLSFVRFSHSVFALPFALAGALLASRQSPITAATRRLDSRGHGVGAQRGHGIQPARRCADGRAESADRQPGAAARRDVDARSRAVCGGRVGLFRLLRRGGSARCASCCRRWRWPSCSGIRWPSGTRRGRRCFSAWRWPWRRSAGGWPSAGAPAGSRGCWRWRSARGSAGSTCCMPVRTWSSIARTACGRFLSGSAWPRSLAISRAMHVVTIACLLALPLVTPLPAWYEAGRRAGRRAAGVRTVARQRGRSLAGQASIRHERVRRHSVSDCPGGGRLWRMSRIVRLRWR